MKFRYTPEGAPPKEWAFKAEKLLNVEAEEIERRTSMTFGEWANALERNSVLAFHGLLYTMLKRETPTLKWDQIVFAMGEVGLDLELDEMVAARDQLREQLPTFDDGKREQAAAALAALDAEIAEATPGEPEAPEPTPGDEAPKASPSFGRHGGLPSPTTSTSDPVSSIA